MRNVTRWAAVLVIFGLAGSIVDAQVVPKRSGRTAASLSYRTLSGRVADVKTGGQTLTLSVGGSGGGRSNGTRGQSWVLSVGNQTLLLRAGRNHQYTDIDFADLQKGDSVQAVVELEANAADRSHNTWWLVVYPAGTTPAPR